jgi:hypothetical protein
MSPVSSRPGYRHASERRDVEVSIGEGGSRIRAAGCGDGWEAVRPLVVDAIQSAQSCQRRAVPNYNGQCHAGFD